jgi:NADH-quinone oxidoreductase subunit L
MSALIPIIPGLPLAGFLIIVLFGRIIKQQGIAWIAVGSVFLSAIATLLTGIGFLSSSTAGGAFTSTVYTWVNAGGFTADISFRFDELSLVFCFVITFVGALIHLYSVEFMKDDDGFKRFFAYMNLFVAFMLILVLADNLLLLYL